MSLPASWPAAVVLIDEEKSKDGKQRFRAIIDSPDGRTCRYTVVGPIQGEGFKSRKMAAEACAIALRKLGSEIVAKEKAQTGHEESAPADEGLEDFADKVLRSLNGDGEMDF